MLCCIFSLNPFYKNLGLHFIDRILLLTHNFFVLFKKEMLKLYFISIHMKIFYKPTQQRSASE